MHELAITESIVSAVAERMADAPIRRLKVEIGRLSGVFPDSVRFCFELVAAGTTLQDAVLEIDEPHGRVRCRTCGTEFETDDLIALCSCGSVDVELLSGAQLLIREVELA